MKKNTKIIRAIVVIFVICLLGCITFRYELLGLYNYQVMKSYIKTHYGSDFVIIDNSLEVVEDEVHTIDYVAVKQDGIYYRITCEYGNITSDNHDDCLKGRDESNAILDYIGFDIASRNISIQSECDSSSKLINSGSFRISINDNLDYKNETWLYDFYANASSRYESFIILITINDPTTGLLTHTASFTEASNVSSIDSFWAKFS